MCVLWARCVKWMGSQHCVLSPFPQLLLSEGQLLGLGAAFLCCTWGKVGAEAGQERSLLCWCSHGAPHQPGEHKSCNGCFFSCNSRHFEPAFTYFVGVTTPNSIIPLPEPDLCACSKNTPTTPDSHVLHLHLGGEPGPSTLVGGNPAPRAVSTHESPPLTFLWRRSRTSITTTVMATAARVTSTLASQ